MAKQTHQVFKFLNNNLISRRPFGFVCRAACESSSYQRIFQRRALIVKIFIRAIDVRIRIATEETTEILAGDTCACRDLNIVAPSEWACRKTPSVSKVKLPSAATAEAAAAMKNHVLNVFESGRHSGLGNTNRWKHPTRMHSDDKCCHLLKLLEVSGALARGNVFCVHIEQRRSSVKKFGNWNPTG